MVFPGQNRQSYLIVDGPDRDAMFDSMRLFEKKIKVRFVWISSEDTRQDIDVQVFAIQMYVDEDHPEGGTWLMQGHGSDPISEDGRFLCMIYSTKSRTGKLMFPSELIMLTATTGDGESMGCEGMYVKIERNGAVFHVGPFDTPKDRTSFFDDLKEKVPEEELETSVELVHAIPASGILTAPETFSGLSMFDQLFSDAPDAEEDEGQADST